MFELLLRLFEDEKTKDVTFTLSDGHLAAHSLVLKQASEVWSRMFDTDMVEGKSRDVNMSDVKSKSMRVFLRLLYTAHVCSSDWGEESSASNTGTGSETVPLDVLLDVASLAKKYMVTGTLSIAVEALKARLQATTQPSYIDVFTQVAALAIASDVGPLRMAVIEAAKKCPQVKQAFHDNALPPEVLFELQALWPASAARPQKMARLA